MIYVIIFGVMVIALAVGMLVITLKNDTSD